MALYDNPPQVDPATGRLPSYKQVLQQDPATGVYKIKYEYTPVNQRFAGLQSPAEILNQQLTTPVTTFPGVGTGTGDNSDDETDDEAYLSRAKILDKYCDLILVGDSMANVLYGNKTTHDLKLQTIINHAKSVSLGAKKSLVVVDMPKGSYKTPSQAKKNAKFHSLTSNLKFYCKPVQKIFNKKFDLVVSNPPYIVKRDIKRLSNDIKKLEMTVEKENQTKNYEESISIMDGLFDKLSETSGMDAFLDSVDELFSEMDSEEINVEEVKIKSDAVIELYNKEVSWRSAAKQDLMPKLQEYNLAIKETIGLRLQSKLTKEQAIYVSRCNSIHRDISLNF